MLIAGDPGIANLGLPTGLYVFLFIFPTIYSGSIFAVLPLPPFTSVLIDDVSRDHEFGIP